MQQLQDHEVFLLRAAAILHGLPVDHNLRDAGLYQFGEGNLRMRTSVRGVRSADAATRLFFFLEHDEISGIALGGIGNDDCIVGVRAQMDLMLIDAIEADTRSVDLAAWLEKFGAMISNSVAN